MWFGLSIRNTKDKRTREKEREEERRGKEIEVSKDASGGHQRAMRALEGLLRPLGLCILYKDSLDREIERWRERKGGRRRQRGGCWWAARL